MHDADKHQVDCGFQIQVVDRPVMLQQLALLLNMTLTGFAGLQAEQAGSMPILVAIVSEVQ